MLSPTQNYLRYVRNFQDINSMSFKKIELDCIYEYSDLGAVRARWNPSVECNAPEPLANVRGGEKRRHFRRVKANHLQST